MDKPEKVIESILSFINSPRPVGEGVGGEGKLTKNKKEEIGGEGKLAHAFTEK